MSSVSKQIQLSKQKDLFEFLKYSTYKSFLRLAKGELTLEQVKHHLGDRRVGIGGGLVNQIQQREMRDSYRYFETFNQWQWFDLYHLTSHEWWLLWQDVYQTLYKPDKHRSKDGYKHLTGNERGLLYLFSRLVNQVPEDDYYYWALPELFSLPTDIINLIPIDPNKELEFNNDYFAIERVGDQLVKEIQHQVKHVLKDRQLNKEWREYLSYINESLDWVLAHIKDDPRYQGKLQRFIAQTKLIFNTSQDELRSLKRIKNNKS